MQAVGRDFEGQNVYAPYLISRMDGGCQQLNTEERTQQKSSRFILVHVSVRMWCSWIWVQSGGDNDTTIAWDGILDHSLLFQRPRSSCHGYGWGWYSSSPYGSYYGWLYRSKNCSLFGRQCKACAVHCWCGFWSESWYHCTLPWRLVLAHAQAFSFEYVVGVLMVARLTAKYKIQW